MEALTPIHLTEMEEEILKAEALMQRVWQHRLWIHGKHLTCCGSLPVSINNPGTLNQDAGPDFFNASVRIGDEEFYGNIELHLRASDWYRHNHHLDPAYDSVILHVVQIDDAVIKRSNGCVIPQIVVRCSHQGAQRCNSMVQQAAVSLPCYGTIRSLPGIYHTQWVTTMGMERLQTRAERILQIKHQLDNRWDDAAYVTLARALGFGLNADPFEVLAKNLPLNFLRRHRGEISQVEALLFGQAALIPPPDQREHPYITRLRQDHRHLANKFNLHPLPLQWKMARTRPQNFPYRRLAMLAQLVADDFYILSYLDQTLRQLENARQESYALTRDCYSHIPEPLTPTLPSFDTIRELFRIHLHGFWATHYSFDATCTGTAPALSPSAIDGMIINVAIPLMMARALERNDIDTIMMLPELLHILPPENNRITRLFTSAGLPCRDAFESQALIHLRKEYCTRGKCLYCHLGHRMLATIIQS